MTDQQQAFKMLDCTLLKTKLLRLPPLALKLWEAHFAHEGEDCQSYPSVETLMDMCRIENEDTVYKWRAWLQRHGWLKKVGERQADNGKFAIPVFSCTQDGTVPERIMDGRKDNRPRLNHGRAALNESGTDRPERIRVEVEPEKQVEPKKQVDAAATFSQCAEKSKPADQPTQDINPSQVRDSVAGESDEVPPTPADDFALTRKFVTGGTLTLSELVELAKQWKQLNKWTLEDIEKSKTAGASKDDLTIKREYLRSGREIYQSVEIARKAEVRRLKILTAESKVKGKNNLEELRAKQYPAPSPAAEALARSFAEIHSTEFYPADARLLEPMAAKYSPEDCTKAFRFMVGHKFWGDKSAAFLAKSKDGKPWFITLMEQSRRSKSGKIGLPQNQVTQNIHSMEVEQL